MLFTSNITERKKTIKFIIIKQTIYLCVKKMCKRYKSQKRVPKNNNNIDKELFYFHCKEKRKKAEAELSQQQQKIETFFQCFKLSSFLFVCVLSIKKIFFFLYLVVVEGGRCQEAVVWIFIEFIFLVTGEQQQQRRSCCSFV